MPALLSTRTASQPAARVQPAREEAIWDSTLARCIATLLIANSHLEAFYPRSWLAADGLLGNTLFFMVSGIGLGMRNRTRELSFSQWYRRRVLRIYPSLWICVIGLSLIAGGAWAAWAPLDYVRNLLWPTGYGFIRLIMVYYVAAYVLLRRFGGAPAWTVSIAALLSVGVAVPIATELPSSGRLSLGTIPDAFWWTWWLLMFLLGMALPRWRLPALSNAAMLWVIASCSILYVAVKYAMVVGGVFPRAFLLLLALGASLAVCLIVAGARSDLILQWLARKRLGAAIRWLGARSLEVYVTHVFVAARPEIVQLPFPLNVVAFFAATLLLTEIAFRLAAALRRRLEPA